MIDDRRRSGIKDRREKSDGESTIVEAALTNSPEKWTAHQVTGHSYIRHLSLQTYFKKRERVLRKREASIASREIKASSHELCHDASHQFAMDQQDLNAELMLANEQLIIASIQTSAVVEDLENSRAEMAHLANHDFLTDLPNRMQLYDRIGQAITLAMRNQTKLAILFLDLDKFKKVNDTLGHAVGDELLKAVAERLKKTIRQSDTVSRQGGDEFVLLLCEVGDEEALRPTIEKVHQVISEPYHLAGHELHIGVTIGVSIFPEHGDDTETLVRCADTAMYHAKQDGRNQHRFFSSEMHIEDDDYTDPGSGKKVDPAQMLLF